MEVLETMFISSPREMRLEATNFSSGTSNLTIGELLQRETSFSVLWTSPLLILLQVEDELEEVELSLEVV